MELVYLWIEDYKNIHNQGFNFSSKFKCEFDKENETLTIEDNPNHIDNFFGENINITAIVGKNGSGKSAILEVLLSALSENRESDSLLSNGIPPKYFLIYKHDNTYYSLYRKFTSKNLIIKSNHQFTIKWKIEKSLESHKNLISIVINNELATRLIFNEYEQLFISSTKSDINDIQKIIASNFINNRSTTFRKETNKFFIPTKIEIKSLYNLKEVNDEIKKLLSEKEFLIDDINKQIDLLEKDFHRKSENIFDKMYVNTETTLHSFNLADVDKQKLEKIFSLKKNDLIDIEICNDDKSFKDLSYGEKQLLANLNFILFYSEQEKYNKERYGNDEKTGEPISGIEKIDSKEILILLDEIELGLHPNWQKKSIKYMIDFLGYFHKKVHLTIASHSPFILSDIPKENVIFLEKGKQVYPFDDNQQTFGANIHTLLSHGFFMKDGLMGEFAKEKIEEIKKFYEFVNRMKKIINKQGIKDRVNNLFEKRKNRFYNIQTLIGEPFLKTIMKNYLDELEQIFDNETYKNRKKEELLKQFSKEELEAYIKEIK